MKKVIISLAALICFFAGITVFVYNYCFKPENNDVAHIVYTSDEKYTEYTKVAILSAIMNKNPDSVYDINVLCVDLPEAKCKEFEKMTVKNAKISTRPLSIESIKHVGNYEVHNNLSRADLFKFFMPEIFKEYDKILYLDSDTIVLKDLMPLYNTNLRIYPIGAVKKMCYNPVWKKYLGFYWFRHKEWHYNCGIILFNLDMWRKHNITQRVIDAKERDMIRGWMTQTALNEAMPMSKVKSLSPVYNTWWKTSERDWRVEKFKEIYYPYLNDMNSVQDLFNECVIMHYAASDKPWFSPNEQNADIWWKYAKMINPDWKPENFKGKYVYE